MLLFGRSTTASNQMLPALALACDNVTIVIVRSAGITIAGLATVPFFRQPPILRKTLVTIASRYVTFTSTFPRIDVTTLVVNCSIRVTSTILTTIRVGVCEIPKTVFANITTSTFDVGFTMTTSGYQTIGRICNRIANTVIQGAVRVAIASWKKDISIKMFSRKTTYVDKLQDLVCHDRGLCNRTVYIVRN